MNTQNNSSMKAAVIRKAGSLKLEQLPLPKLKPGQALIKVNYCGICGSDVHILQGAHPTATFPRVPGHEFVGELVEVCGEGAEGFTQGDIVVAQPFFSCGNCEPCAKGHDNVCRSLKFMGAHADGAFAEYVVVLTRKMYKLPKDIDQRLAALAEPVAVAVHDVRRSGLAVGETALVIGGGPIGILIALIARRAGASRVVIAELNPWRISVAQELGFETADPTQPGYMEKVMEMSGGGGFDVVFEVSGSKPGVASATALAKNAGKIMVVGMTGEPYPVDLSAVFAKELRIEGVRIHDQYNFIGALEIIKSGVLNNQFARLITDEYTMDSIEEAFDYAQKPGNYLKILVKV